MKKLITIILFIFSMQIFAEQYQVIKQKNVTLSKEKIDLENKKIEETVSKYPKKVLKEMISYYFSVASKVVIPDSDKILDDKEMKKRFFKKYGYEMKDDEDFLSTSEVKKRKDIINEMLKEGVRNPKNYMTDEVTNELNKIGNEWEFKDAKKFEEMLNKIK